MNAIWLCTPGRALRNPYFHPHSLDHVMDSQELNKRKMKRKASDAGGGGSESTSKSAGQVLPAKIYSAAMRPGPPSAPATRLISWNVNGIRAVLKKDPLAIKKLVQSNELDVLCLQEVKCAKKDLDKDAIETILRTQLSGWKGFEWSFAAKAGYSGTAILSKEKPIKVIKSIETGNEEFDSEGRIVAGEYDKFWLVNAYSPNSGAKLDRLSQRTTVWDIKLAAFCKELESQGKPVLLTGDLNCAHKEIDIHSPKTNLKSAGFTIEERESFGKNFIDSDLFVDTFRRQHPDAVGFTYFSHRFDARASHRGWRLDYWLVSQTLSDKVHDSFILKEVEGSDHVPVGLILMQ